ncbi:MULTISPECIES: hypothetical protein [Sphingobium]|uniref:Uncharacterized protein n=1 Tax=Sphingobium cupriresistens LL01 TaxID=1420583 RepID=A0A0J7XR53_9SPHN|nr:MULTISPECIES: hypothetical protein [Sphingobium]KMS54167.1 hypothetical protein V473_16665 [Sphingobium cupriresistens LL01]MBJ7378382.1 hypothetical protein [Sphingobium sp.]
MWKSLLTRRPLRRPDKAKDDPPPRDHHMVRDTPFADLMAKLDRIPYRRTRKPAFGGR